MVGFSFIDKEMKLDKTPPSRPKYKGFTLIEIVISTLLIGVLTSLALTTQTKITIQAKLIEAKTLVNAGLKNGLLLHKQNRLDSSMNCQDLGLSTAYTPHWTYTCKMDQGILSIRATSNGNEGILTDQVSKGTWTLDLNNGALLTGTPLGI